MAIIQMIWKKVIAIIAILVISLVLYAVRDARTQSDVSEFPQPEVINSENGVLETSLEVKLAFNTVEDPVTGEIREIETPTYEGTLTGPTLRVKPGDNMLIDIKNNLPPNPPGQRGHDDGGFAPFPHDPFTTNLHTHGLSVSPKGKADNPLREMPPDTIKLVDIQIPPDHQTGTFWYHPHKHGSVSFQFFGGMSGFLIIEGGEGTLDDVPQVKAAKDVLMAFQAIRTDQRGKVPFVNLNSSRFSSEGTNGVGLWSTYQNSFFYLTTNGVTNPVLNMRPGEVQRWRLLNASSGLTLVVALKDHELNIIANDGITVPEMVTLKENQPYVMGSGNRVDVLIKAVSKPGIYLLQAINPRGRHDDEKGFSVITQSGIDPAPRPARTGFDFPVVDGELEVQGVTYPYTLATIVVSGDEMNMSLPDGPLPVPEGLPSIETLLNAKKDGQIDAVRNIAFEICGTAAGMTFVPDNPGPVEHIPRLPSCGWYFEQYDADYWGGIAIRNLLMMRDADDGGEPNTDPATKVEMPLINFKKEGLFDPFRPLFGYDGDQPIFAGNIEEWTIFNSSFSDHPHHIHTNPFLVTHINGIPLPQPEYRDTIIVPAAMPLVPPLNFMPDITTATPGSITYLTEFDPTLTGMTLMHCHILTHEDLGMMQLIDILE